MQKYKSVFKKKSLKEQISFLDVYKGGSDDVMTMVEEFIKRFKAPRVELYRALATLFATLQSEAEQQIKERSKR